MRVVAESYAVVMTKVKERDGVTKYIVNRRVRFPLAITINDG